MLDTFVKTFRTLLVLHTEFHNNMLKGLLAFDLLHILKAIRLNMQSINDINTVYHCHLSFVYNKAIDK